MMTRDESARHRQPHGKRSDRTFWTRHAIPRGTPGSRGSGGLPARFGIVPRVTPEGVSLFVARIVLYRLPLAVVEVGALDAKLVEAMVSEEGFVRGYRPLEMRLRAGGPARYRLNGGVVLPNVGQELRLTQVILLAAAERADATREEILDAAQANTPSGQRAFAVLVRQRVLVRTNAVTSVHMRSRRQERDRVAIEGVVLHVGGTHPQKRRLQLRLPDGSRVQVFCYGAQAAIAARLGKGACVRIDGCKLADGPRTVIRAVVVEQVPDSGLDSDALPGPGRRQGTAFGPSPLPGPAGKDAAQAGGMER